VLHRTWNEIPTDSRAAPSPRKRDRHPRRNASLPATYTRSHTFHPKTPISLSDIYDGTSGFNTVEGESVTSAIPARCASRFSGVTGDDR
jgi:hypothetical protein